MRINGAVGKRFLKFHITTICKKMLQIPIKTILLYANFENNAIDILNYD